LFLLDDLLRPFFVTILRIVALVAIIAKIIEQTGLLKKIIKCFIFFGIFGIFSLNLIGLFDNLILTFTRIDWHCAQQSIVCALISSLGEKGGVGGDYCSFQDFRSSLPTGAALFVGFCLCCKSESNAK